MAEPFKFDVFLSHNHADKPRVRRLAQRLKAAGVRVWLDDWVIQAGDIIALKVDEGLEQSRVLLLCISPAALASGWVALERSTAVHRDPANAGRRFIPLLPGDCDLPDTLRRYKVCGLPRRIRRDVCGSAGHSNQSGEVCPVSTTRGSLN
jgi:hypothetical protein